MTVVAVIKYVTVPPHSFISKDFYRPQTKFGQGNIFTGVSLSGGGGGLPACSTGHMTGGSASWGLHPGGGGVCIQGDEGLHPGGWAVPPSHVCLWGGSDRRPPLHPQKYMGYYRIRSTSGRYASYWNAFLFIFLIKVCHLNVNVN